MSAKFLQTWFGIESIFTDDHTPRIAYRRGRAARDRGFCDHSYDVEALAAAWQQGWDDVHAEKLAALKAKITEEGT